MSDRVVLISFVRYFFSRNTSVKKHCACWSISFISVDNQGNWLLKKISCCEEILVLVVLVRNDRARSQMDIYCIERSLQVLVAISFCDSVVRHISKVQPLTSWEVTLECFIVTLWSNNRWNLHCTSKDEGVISASLFCHWCQVKCVVEIEWLDTWPTKLTCLKKASVHKSKVLHPVMHWGFHLGLLSWVLKTWGGSQITCVLTEILAVSCEREESGELVPSHTQLLIYPRSSDVCLKVTADIDSTVRNPEHVHVHYVRDRTLEVRPRPVPRANSIWSKATSRSECWPCQNELSEVILTLHWVECGHHHGMAVEWVSVVFS